MKCFRHPQSDAVGVCKYCFKGACVECVKDTEVGVVCSPKCEEEVRSIKTLMDRSKQAFPLAAKTHLRNSIFITLFALGFLAFSLVDRNDPFMFPFLLSFAVIFSLGALFSFLMSRRFTKASRTQT